MNDLCSKLDEYLEGELPADAKVQFESHLDECEVCRMEVSIAATLDESICDAWETVRAPDSLLKSVNVTGINNRTHELTKPKLIVIALATAAAIAILTSVAVWFAGQVSTVDDIASHSETENENQIDRSTQPQTSRQLVALFDTGGDSDSILIPTEQQNENFTIVKAYRTISFDSSSSFDLPSETEIKDNSNEPPN